MSLVYIVSGAKNEVEGTEHCRRQKEATEPGEKHGKQGGECDGLARSGRGL